ncbi:hypothetical protein GCM10010448_39470 [Streptomyces glomeratus]|uniref:DNA-binding protein n=2 Tax=Streptomyces glomeratus TaxID=284452 RepID=A0ABP6LS86_9ACTN|nr:hypothetical protein [Streptomyces glomeratus]MCF1510801.1 hypothetical protein [Streptomyces glomeratus]
MTLRQWALDGKIPFTWVGRERRFSSVDVRSADDRRRLLAESGQCSERGQVS